MVKAANQAFTVARIFVQRANFNCCCTPQGLHALPTLPIDIGRLPVILNSIKYCDRQEGMQLCLWHSSKAVYVGGNSITKTTHKTMHSTPLRKWSNRPGYLPVFWTVCNKKLGRSLGTRLGFSIMAQPFSLHPYIYILFWFLCWTQLPSFCFIIQVEDAIPKLQQLSLASKSN